MVLEINDAADYENLKLENQLCVPIHRAARAIATSYRPMLDKIGLTYSQYSVMVVLWERGRATVGELGELLSLDSGTLSPMLKRLESHGYVSRRACPEDRRVVEIEVTQVGLDLRPFASEAQRQVAVCSGLTMGDFHRIRADLERIIGALSDS